MVSPAMGRLTDHLGSVVATRLVLVTSAATLTALALSPTYGFLLAVVPWRGMPWACSP